MNTEWPPSIGIDPYYSDDYTVIYCADCRDVLPLLPKVDLVLTDPPYGMSWDTNTDRFSGGCADSVARRGVGKSFQQKIVNDDEPFDPHHLLCFPRAIMFGSNHYAQRLPTGTTLVWVKRLDGAFGSFLSDAEVAWMKGGHGVYCFRDLSMTAEARTRKHPSQKPIPLMRWCIEKSGSTSGIILDPYMGSGTTLVAGKSLGRKCIGVEIEERYCEIAARRLRQEYLPLTDTTSHDTVSKNQMEMFDAETV
jgi:DNA modification methylase